MGTKDYEQFVARVLACLKCFRSATLSRNRRFQGVRQPGSYEVDIALEITLDDVVSIFVIVECKNWRRPVDRPVIQKLVQTRDAIAAHKAAVVSPIGFTPQAIEVARAHGVALWVVTETTFYTFLSAGQSSRKPSPADVKSAFVNLRSLMFRDLKIASGLDAAYALMELQATALKAAYKQDIYDDDPLQWPETLKSAALGHIANAVLPELSAKRGCAISGQNQSVPLFDTWLAAAEAEFRRICPNLPDKTGAIDAIQRRPYQTSNGPLGLKRRLLRRQGFGALARTCFVVLCPKADIHEIRELAEPGGVP